MACLSRPILSKAISNNPSMRVSQSLRRVARLCKPPDRRSRRRSRQANRRILICGLECPPGRSLGRAGAEQALKSDFVLTERSENFFSNYHSNLNETIKRLQAFEKACRRAVCISNHGHQYDTDAVVARSRNRSRTGGVRLLSSGADLDRCRAHLARLEAHFICL